MAKTNATHKPRPDIDRRHRELSTAVITFHEAVSRQLGMSAAERKVLSVLAEMGVTTPSKLAGATGLSTGAITGIVDRLEKAGYAQREPNPDDRRSLLIRPLQLARLQSLLAPMFQSLTESMNKLAREYTPEQLDLIQNYLARTTVVLKQETEKLSRREDKADQA